MLTFVHMKTYQQLWQSLTPLYDAGEAQAIVRTVLEVRYGMTFTDIICGKVNELSADKGIELEKIIERLQKAEPVQYILGETNFAGRTFHVAPGVLIPRPETAELCDWITEESSHPERASSKYNILDICTGSGCIAITLALNIPNSIVTGWDISDEALHIAKENTKTLGASHVNIEHQDALALPLDNRKWDIIVSNPPYICNKEKANMEKNVLEHEPSIALFVPNEDPLRFYRAIAEYASTALKPNGELYFEINPIYVEEMKQMLDDFHFSNIKVKKDMEGKERMMKTSR